MSLDSLISALRQEMRRIDEAIVAVENLIAAHEQGEEAAAAFEARYGTRPAPPTTRCLHRHRIEDGSVTTCPPAFHTRRGGAPA